MKSVSRPVLVCFLLCVIIVAGISVAETLLAKKADQPIPLLVWKTDWSRFSISRDELQPGGPGKHGIPSIRHPKFVNHTEAASWLEANEPVIYFTHEGIARAYPIQILMWHEIVNDVLDELSVAVTFCPLCHSALVFDRRVMDQTLTFGVSGFLRHSDMVMYDHQTESLWQQFTGEALFGDFVGHSLKHLPAQIISFQQFTDIAPQGQVLSRDTGKDRDYGRNPYTGYDSIDRKPFLFRGPYDERLAPMQRVVGVTQKGKSKAYAYTDLEDQHVINDEWAGKSLAVFWQSGTQSALDQEVIANSRDVGATGVFDRHLGERTLTFHRHNGQQFIDQETNSTWTLTGQAINGPLTGSQLTPIPHGDYFAFAFLVFYPQAEVYKANSME